MAEPSFSGPARPSRWVEAALRHVSDRAVGRPLDRSLRVTLNFHPDRVFAGRTVLEWMAQDGTYRNQFETGTSNGGLTAYPGGARWLWEQRIFGHAYDEAPADQRPKYGALDHRRRPIGAAPRFGSSYLRLTEDVLDRTTFCFPDSVLEPADFATAERFDLFPLVEAFDRHRRTDAVERHEGGVLDDYVEAHVHGPIDLRYDAECLVLDPSFRGTDLEEQAAALGVDVGWHEGRVLHVDELAAHPDFRGDRAVEVGRQVAEDDLLDAAVIGRARERGAHDIQDLKRVWHCVARFGSPREHADELGPEA